MTKVVPTLPRGRGGPNESWEGQQLRPRPLVSMSNDPGQGNNGASAPKIAGTNGDAGLEPNPLL